MIRKNSHSERLKQAAALLLIIVMVINNLGELVVFKVRQAQVRQEVKSLLKRGVNEHALQHFAFHANEITMLDWERKGKEFKYKGAMFDIVRTEIDGTVTHFYCINDVQERELFTDLQAAVDKRMNHDAAVNLAGKMIISVCELIMLHAFCISADAKLVVVYPTFATNLSDTIQQSPPTPPPKTVYHLA